MIWRLLRAGPHCRMGSPASAAEVVQNVEQKHCKAILISAVPPNATYDAGYLARRLRRQLPDVKIAVGLWAAGENPSGAARERLAKLCVDEGPTPIPEAPDALRRLVDAGKEKPKPT